MGILIVKKKFAGWGKRQGVSAHGISACPALGKNDPKTRILLDRMTHRPGDYLARNHSGFPYFLAAATKNRVLSTVAL